MATFASMAFYESISDLYDFIFPLNPAQTGFVKTCFTEFGQKTILDVGCGTGNLSIALSTDCKEIYGIDPDLSMLEIAKEKAGRDHPNLHFSPHGMLDIAPQFSDIDAILCFGNTMVHLSSETEVSDFLQQARKALTPRGKLLVQIINYDRILDKAIQGLPGIENDKISFVRRYNYLPAENSIEFETTLTIKDNGQQIHNLIHLLPIRKSSLDVLLKNAGFKSVKYYGNFKKDALTSDSVPLVFEAGT